MGKPLRILQVGLTQNPGGIESVIMNLYRNLDRDVVQFDFLSMAGEALAYEDEIADLGGVVYKELHRLKQNPPGYYQGINNFLKTHGSQYAALHHNACELSYMLPCQLAKKHGIRTRIFHNHSEQFVQQPSPLRKLVVARHLKTMGASVTDFFACSTRAGAFLFQNRYDFIVIPNAIDTESFAFDEGRRRRLRKEFGFGDDVFVLGAVGRIDPVKNPHFILTLLAEVLKREPQAVLLWVGSGSLDEEIAAQAENLGIKEKIRFLGLRRDLADLYQGMDAFVLPSLVEGIPVTGIEAQSAGLPCYYPDHIARESDLTGLVNYLSLAAGPVVWAREILARKEQHSRKGYARSVAAAGYDIRKTALDLQRFYWERAHAE